MSGPEISTRATEMRDTARPQREVENNWGCGEGREKMSGVFMGRLHCISGIQISSQERTLMGGGSENKRKKQVAFSPIVPCETNGG